MTQRITTTKEEEKKLRFRGQPIKSLSSTHCCWATSNEFFLLLLFNGILYQNKIQGIFDIEQKSIIDFDNKHLFVVVVVIVLHS